MSRRIPLLAAGGALVLAAPVAVQAAKPAGKPAPTSSISIGAAPNTVLYGRTVLISGKLTAKVSSGVMVSLEAAPYPYTTFRAVRSVTTGPLGTYSFTAVPALNTEYRVKAKAKPAATSSTRLVSVRPRVSLHVSDATPKAGTRVRFSGSLSPAHDGQLVLIQRRSRSGRFVTVARTTLLHSATGASIYRRTLRVAASGTYRVAKTHDADHATGFSSLKRIVVH